MYELVGIVVHSGQASAGHYYSFIKDRRWSVFRSLLLDFLSLSANYLLVLLKLFRLRLFAGFHQQQTSLNLVNRI